MTSVVQGASITLTAEWFEYAGGPATDVSGLTITITPVTGGAAAVGPTSTGIVHVTTGVYTYTWAVPGSQTPGTYTIVWNATGATVQAAELVDVILATTTSEDQAPWYVTREQVKQALDIKQTTRNDAQVDRACDAGSRAVEGLCHRIFYPYTSTHFFDWPNYQYAYPWRLWLDHREIADVTTNVPVLTTGGVTISNSDIFWEPVNSGPPYTYLELDRSTVAAFGVNKTPQHDIAITGTFGYWVRTAAAGALAANVTTTTAASVTVTNGAAMGVGDHILVDSERMIVTDKTMVSSGYSQLSGATTASVADVTLAVTDGTKFAVGEILLLDSERMLVVDISGNNLTVKRAWDGSVLATHTTATIYALRGLTVVRGALGSTAATHTSGAAIVVGLVPGMVRSLALAEAVNQLVSEQGAYARTQGASTQTNTSKANAQGSIGAGLDGLRSQVYRRYGRKTRVRVI